MPRVRGALGKIDKGEPSVLYLELPRGNLYCPYLLPHLQLHNKQFTRGSRRA